MLLFGEDKLRAVAYYRFSAEDKQENSIENQREAVEKKASQEDIEIVETFQDEGISGLTFDRPDFQALLEKYVYADDPPRIDYILFYDASRFGRVQKISHAWRLIADMEDHNIRLGSVDRGIPRSDMSVADTIIMTLDFVMSKEYVRLLSAKVSAGCKKIASQGYSAGGIAPYGYVRVLLDEQRNRVRVLKPGVRKEVSNQRVAFEPAKTGEAEVVKRIFNEFTGLTYFPNEIADRLNEGCVPTATGKTWNASGIIRILTNETYTGTRIYNKTWAKLKEQKRANPPEEWVRCPHAHEALISEEVFREAQDRLHWLRPRSRNQAARATTNSRNYVNKYIEDVIQGFSEDQKHYIRRYLPLSYGAIYDDDGVSKTCFYLPVDKTKLGKVLAFGVDSTKHSEQPLFAAYILSTGNACQQFLVVEHSTDLKPLSVMELQEALLELASLTVDHNASWLSTLTSSTTRVADQPIIA